MKLSEEQMAKFNEKELEEFKNLMKFIRKNCLIRKIESNYEASDNTKPLSDKIVSLIKNEYSIFYSLFIWDESSEGFDFWCGVKNRYQHFREGEIK